MDESVVFIKIMYDSKREVIAIGDTNIKDERISDFLTDYLTEQIGKGKDERKVVDKDIYEVIVTLDLSEDIFHVNSDTGNDSLTTGIIMGLVARLEIEDKKGKKKYEKRIVIIRN